jgi:tRNA(fMet)-specific endonuclease VapC
MSYILDTNIVSELAADNPEPRVLQWIRGRDENRLYLSVITLGELTKGVTKLADSKRKDELRLWLDESLIPRFRNRILLLDIPTMQIWGEMVAFLENVGRPMPALDSLLAATALHSGFALVTRNAKDFVHPILEIINPWEV